jgi:threonine dehydratase
VTRRGHTTTAHAAVLDLADIVAARRAIGGRLHKTPIFSSARTSERVGARVLLKAELLQRTGSFKPRGVLAKLATLTPAELRRGVITASSGNHAQALAYCARELGIDCVAVMWAGVSQQKIDATRHYGARVDLTAADGVDALSRARDLAEEHGTVLVPAYDDPAVMAGQGTLGLEILETVPNVDAVVVPVSGGGLIAGIAVAVKASRAQTKILAVEPESSPALALALAAGHPVAVPPASIADSLGAPSIGALCLTTIAPLVDDVVHVSDDEIRHATRWLYQSAKLACEPAGAATTAALLSGRVCLSRTSTVVAVVSGGNIDAPDIAELLAETSPGS